MAQIIGNNVTMYGNLGLGQGLPAGVEETIPLQANSKPRQGGQTVRYFKGVPAGITTLASQMLAFGYETNISTSPGPTWELTATLPYDMILNPGLVDIPTVFWEIVPHPIERHILECNDRPVVAGLTPHTKELIEYNIKNPATSVPIVSDNEYTPNLFYDAYTVFSLMRIGVEAKQEFTTAIKRTIIVSTKYVPTWTILNVNKVISTSSLITAYAIPNYVSIFMRPSKTEAIDPTDTTSAGDPNRQAFYGWLEQHPTVQNVTYNKIQISQEWVYNKWAMALYDVIQ